MSTKHPVSGTCVEDAEFETKENDDLEPPTPRRDEAKTALCKS